MKYRSLAFLIHLFLPPLGALEVDAITPFKFTDENRSEIVYDIPASSRFTTKRSSMHAPDIIYYLSKPDENEYPIAILCGGSSDQDHIESIIHFHRYLLQELLDLGAGVLTVEQWGVDGRDVNVQPFMEHYTRTQRLEDHRNVIENLRANPPKGWNGKLIFLGCSEGGPLVTRLTEEYAETTLATVNWCGAGDWSWDDELWVFLQRLLIDNPQCPHLNLLSECVICSECFTSRERYEAQMNETIQNPTSEQKFLNMTYKYHADALLFPKINYQKIRTPFLVVTCALDTLIESSDAFVEKAKSAGANITYLRIADMDHYIRKRPEIVRQSFDWLGVQIDILLVR